MNEFDFLYEDPHEASDAEWNWQLKSDQYSNMDTEKEIENDKEAEREMTDEIDLRPGQKIYPGKFLKAFSYEKLLIIFNSF